MSNKRPQLGMTWLRTEKVDSELHSDVEVYKINEDEDVDDYVLRVKEFTSGIPKEYWEIRNGDFHVTLRKK